MAEFEITSPEGRKFIVTAPEGASQEDVLRYAQQNMPAAEPEAPAAPSFGRRVLDTVVGAGQGLRNFTRAAQGSQLLGFRDEAQAALTSLMPNGGSYSDNLAAERASARQYEQQNPVASGIATGIGGMVSPAAAIPIGRAGTMAGTMLRTGATGAAAGAVGGFGEGEGGLGPRAAAAGTGALVGGAVGGLLPPVIQGAGALGARVGQAIGVRSPETTARSLVLRDLQRDGVDPNELLRRAQQPGKPEMLADLGGENLLQAGQVVARSPGAGRQIAAENLAGRTGAAQAERLAGDVRQHVSGLDFREEMGALLQQRSQAAAPLYQQAYSVELPRDLRLQRFLNDPDVAEGVRRGVALARREALAADRAFDPAELGIRFADDGSVQLVRDGMPTRLFDIAKRGLDELIEGNTDAVTGRVNAQGRALVQVRDAMVNRLDELNPAYAEARSAFAGPSMLMDAMRLGRNMLREGGERADRTAAEIAKLTPSEREFFRVGVARELMDRISGTVDGAEQTRLNRILMTGAVRDRLRAAFDSDAEFSAFTDALQREASIARTNRTIAPNGGSPTMPMGEKATDLRAPPSGPLASTLTDPERAPVEGMLAAWARSGNLTPSPGVALRNIQQARSENAYRRNTAAMAPMLFTTDPAERARYAQALLEQAVREEQQRRAFAPVVQGVLGGAPVAAGLLAN